MRFDIDFIENSVSEFLCADNREIINDPIDNDVFGKFFICDNSSKILVDECFYIARFYFGLEYFLVTKKENWFYFHIDDLDTPLLIFQCINGVYSITLNNRQICDNISFDDLLSIYQKIGIILKGILLKKLDDQEIIKWMKAYKKIMNDYFVKHQTIF